MLGIISRIKRIKEIFQMPELQGLYPGRKKEGYTLGIVSRKIE